MAAKHTIIRIGNVVVTKESLQAMQVKIAEKKKKDTKESARTKRAWAVRVTEAERVALAAVLAAMRINNMR